MNRAALLAVSAVVLALTVAGCGSDDSSTTANAETAGSDGATQSVAAATSGNNVDASLKEWSISAPQTVKAGKVTFDATNDGSAPHELVVIKTDKPAGDLGSGSEVSEAGSVGEVSDIQPGDSGKKTIDLKPGKYVLICNLPGHYEQGMHTALTVK